MNDPETNQYMETRFSPQSSDDIKNYVMKMKEDSSVLFMAIISRNDNRHIGNIKLGPISRHHQRAYISFFIGDKSYRGKGIATEAVRLLSDYAFRDLSLAKVIGGCYSNNSGSKKVFEKAGFKLEGILKKQFRYENEFVDELCFAKFADEISNTL